MSSLLTSPHFLADVRDDVNQAFLVDRDAGGLAVRLDKFMVWLWRMLAERVERLFDGLRMASSGRRCQRAPS